MTPFCLIILLGLAAAAPAMGQSGYGHWFAHFDDLSSLPRPYNEPGWFMSDPVRVVTPFGLLGRHGWIPEARTLGCGYSTGRPTYVEDRVTHYAPYDEFVELDTDSLQPHPKFEYRWERVRGRSNLRLADGSALVLDRRTRPGVYDLDESWQLVVAQEERGGVRCHRRLKLTRALDFRMVCRRKAGVVVEALEDTTLRSEAQILEDFFRHHDRWIGAVSFPDSSAGMYAAGIRPDLGSRTTLSMPNPGLRLARVTWLTFDADPESRPRYMVDRERRWVPSDSRPGYWQLSAIPPSRRALANARVLGSVLVDLKSGRVVRRAGDVR